MRHYFAKPYELFGGDSNVKVVLFNYTTKPELKNATGIYTSKQPAKSNLEAEVDELDIDKLVPVPVDLSKLSHVVK